MAEVTRMISLIIKERGSIAQIGRRGMAAAVIVDESSFIVGVYNVDSG
jgi:hypothetical protein